MHKFSVVHNDGISFKLCSVSGRRIGVLFDKLKSIGWEMDAIDSAVVEGRLRFCMG